MKKVQVETNGFVHVVEFNDIVMTEDEYNFTFSLPDEYLIYGDNLIRVSVLNDANSILGYADKVISVCANDVAVTYTQMLLDGKQHFNIKINNISNLNCEGYVKVYINGILNKTVDFSILSNQATNLEILFEQISKGDHIYFIVVPNIKDKSKFDNTKAFYSIQDEKKEVILENKYGTLIDSAKQLFGV